MSKKYKIKVTKELIKKLSPYWKEVQNLEQEYWSKIDALEKKISKKIGIEIEIFHCDNAPVGFGEVNRNMRLIQQEDLIKE
jgi:hypothetical protein